MPEDKEKKITTSIILRESVYEWVKDEADENETSFNYIVNMAIKSYMKQKEGQGNG